MKILVSLSAREGIVKGSRVAVRQGSWYWLGTVTRKGASDADVQYDEGSKGKASLRSLTHLPDSAKTLKKPQTKEQIAALKAKAPAAKAPAAKTPAKPAKLSDVIVDLMQKDAAAKKKKAAAKAPAAKALDADQMIAELGLQKVTKRSVRKSSGNQTQHIGYAKSIGGQVPAVNAFLKKRGLAAVYEHDLLEATLSDGTLLRVYPPSKGVSQVQLLVPASKSTADDHHTGLIKELGLDKIDSGSSTARIKSAKGMRLATKFVTATNRDGKDVKNGSDAVLKALTKAGYQRRENSNGTTQYTLDSTSVVVREHKYPTSAYIEFTLFSPGSNKDLPKTTGN